MQDGFKFDVMNLEFTFYKNDRGEWWVRVMDEDTAGSGATAIWSEQPLEQFQRTVATMAYVGHLLLDAQNRREDDDVYPVPGDAPEVQGAAPLRLTG